jgi:hypothetical protein
VIRPLRSRHRAVFVGLVATLPLLFAGALLWRNPVPAVEAHVGPSVAGLEEVFVGRDDLWRGLPIRTSLYRGPQRVTVLLQAREEIGRPDLLVYWSGAAETPDGLPGDVVLLGRLAGLRRSRFDLPVGAGATGRLILYSLAHQEVVAGLALSDAGAAP